MPPRLLALVTLLFACGSKDAGSDGSSPASAAGSSPGPIDAFTEYQRKSMTTEAKVNLGSIARAAESYLMEERVGPDGKVSGGGPPPAAPMTPAPGSCCKQPKHTCIPSKDDWSHPGWQALAFELSDPHRYSYELVPDAGGFVVRAVGDLDCDGELSTHELRATLRDGSVELGQPTSENPLE